MKQRATRRRLLATTAVGAVTSLAGCTELQASLVETTEPADESSRPTDETEQADTKNSGADNQQVQRVGKSIRPAVVSISTQTRQKRSRSATNRR